MKPDIAREVLEVVIACGAAQIYIYTDPPLNVGKLIDYYSAPTGGTPDNINE